MAGLGMTKHEVTSRGTKGGQPCISCGEFTTTLGRRGIIYTFRKTMFAIKNFLYVKKADQNFTNQNFNSIGLELVKI